MDMADIHAALDQRHGTSGPFGDPEGGMQLCPGAVNRPEAGTETTRSIDMLAIAKTTAHAARTSMGSVPSLIGCNGRMPLSQGCAQRKDARSGKRGGRRTSPARRADRVHAKHTRRPATRGCPFPPEHATSRPVLAAPAARKRPSGSDQARVAGGARQEGGVRRPVCLGLTPGLWIPVPSQEPWKRRRSTRAAERTAAPLRPPPSPGGAPPLARGPHSRGTERILEVPGACALAPGSSPTGISASWNAAAA